LEEHFSATFLAQFPPDQLEGLLGASAAARFVEVVSMTATSIDAAIDPGSAQAPLVLSLTVDGDAKIAGLRPSSSRSRGVPSGAWTRCRCLGPPGG